MSAALFSYIIHLADNTLILGQRNSEWCGHGPVLEQDIALTNISLDLLGQARNFYQYATVLYNNFPSAEKTSVDYLIPQLWKTYNRELNEDDLAFLREEQQYLNLLLCELPNGDWAQTILRQFIFSAFQFIQYTQLRHSSDPQLAAIAEKSAKEIAYHLRWSSEWVIRLGDGTEESHYRIKKALEELWKFTGELFLPAGFELEAAKTGFGINPFLLKEQWLLQANKVFEQANLPFIAIEKQETNQIQSGGKEAIHTEHLGRLLSEMQYLQRTYPNVRW